MAVDLDHYGVSVHEGAESAEFGDPLTLLFAPSPPMLQRDISTAPTLQKLMSGAVVMNSTSYTKLFQKTLLLIVTMAFSTVRGYARTGNRNPRPPCSISPRVHCLSLQVEGFSWQDIERKICVKQSQQSHLEKNAYNRGFRHEVNP
jgi:hypothetical protein